MMWDRGGCVALCCVDVIHNCASRVGNWCWWCQKTPGRHKVVPYTNSEVVHCRSSLKADRSPKRMSGSVSIHWLPGAVLKPALS